MNDETVINNGVLTAEEEEILTDILVIKVGMRVLEKEIGEIAAVVGDMMMIMTDIVIKEVGEMITAAVTIHPIEGMM